MLKWFKSFKSLLSLSLCTLFFFVLFQILSFNVPLYAEPAASTTAASASSTAPGANSIAQVVWVKGVVKAISEAKAERTLQRRAPIFQQDTVMTDDTSSGQIVFTDGGLLALKEKTTLSVKEYSFSKSTPSEDKMVVNLAKGGFRTITGAISKSNPGSVKVNTPVGTIGVRGSDVVVALNPKTGQAAIQVNVGSTTLTNLNNETIVIEATPGKTVYATMNSHEKPNEVFTQPSILAPIANIPISEAPPAQAVPAQTQPAAPAVKPATTKEGVTPEGTTRGAPRTKAMPVEGGKDQTQPKGTTTAPSNKKGESAPGAGGVKHVESMCIS